MNALLQTCIRLIGFALVLCGAWIALCDEMIAMLASDPATVMGACMGLLLFSVIPVCLGITLAAFAHRMD